LTSWCAKVESGWAEPYSGVLWKFFRFVNHWNNYLLHHSAVGVTAGVRWRDPEEAPTLLLGPTRDWRDVSLWAAFWCYALLLLAVLRQLSPDRVDDYRAFFEPRAYRFITVTREMARNIGRNELCPCGSERKFKVCHEPYVTDRPDPLRVTPGSPRPCRPPSGLPRSPRGHRLR
jgi:hypothetical protein